MAADQKKVLSPVSISRDVSKFTKEEKAKFLESFDVVFSDCDGVIWHMFGEPIPKATQTIELYQNIGKRVIFVTNNSTKSPDDLMKKFRRCELQVNQGDIIHPSQVVCDHLKSIKFEGLIFCLASNPFKNLLSSAGFEIMEERENRNIETVLDFRSAITAKERVRAVIIDVDLNLTVAKLMRAHQYLMDSDCLFLGGAADALIPFGPNNLIGSGPFITVLENSTNRQATIFGKPGEALAELLKEKYDIKDPSRVLFIGDSLLSDIKFGNRCGFQTLLVLTGGTTIDDVHNELELESRPNFIVDSLGNLS